MSPLPTGTVVYAGRRRERLGRMAGHKSVRRFCGGA
jgi:hypothetical protein